MTIHTRTQHRRFVSLPLPHTLCFFFFGVNSPLSRSQCGSFVNLWVPPSLSCFHPTVTTLFAACAARACSLHTPPKKKQQRAATRRKRQKANRQPSSPATLPFRQTTTKKGRRQASTGASPNSRAVWCMSESSLYFSSRAATAAKRERKRKSVVPQQRPAGATRMTPSLCPHQLRIFRTCADCPRADGL